MTRVGIITQARMTSTRLPGKVLLTAGGKTMLGHHLDRLAAAGYPVIVATTENVTDDPIVDEATARGARVYRGSENDVLSRFSEAAADAELEVVVRVTSDCPLIDASLIVRGVEEYLALDDAGAHVSNVLERTYPRGFDFEVFSAAALADADAHATDPADREHVTPYLYRNRSGRMTMHAIRREADASRFRVTLDTSDDYDVITRLIRRHEAASLDSEQIIAVLNDHPELAELNAHVEQKKLGE
ncbi:glycosyltransferase family protein [Microbacterium shaanxiense]